MATGKIGDLKVGIGVEVDSSVDQATKRVTKSVQDIAEQTKKTGDQVSKEMGKTSKSIAGVEVSYDKLNKTQNRVVRQIERSVVRQTSQTKSAYLDWVASTSGVENATESLRNQLRLFEQQQEQAASAGNKFVQSLREQTETLGMTRRELLEYQATQLGVRDQAQPMIDRLFDTSGAYRSVEMSAKQTRQAMRLLPAQITDVVTSLASGMPIYLVAIQQGGQLRDSFGGLGNVLRGVRALISPTMLAIGGLAAAGAAAYLAYERLNAGMQQVNRTLIETGNSSGVTSSQILAMSKTVAEFAGTQRQAQEALNFIVASNDILSDSYTKVALAAVQWSEATGKSVEDVVSEFQSLAEKPAESLEKLDKQYNFLTVSSYEQVQALLAQGNQADASRILIDELADTIEQRTPKMIEQTNLFAQAWGYVSLGAKTALDDFLSFFDEAGAQELYDETVNEFFRLDELRRQLIRDQAVDPQALEALEYEMSQLELLMGKYSEILIAQKQSAELDREQAQIKRVLADANKVINENLTTQQVLQAGINRLNELYLPILRKQNLEEATRIKLTQAYNLAAQGLVNTYLESIEVNDDVATSTRDVNAEILQSIENYRFETDALTMNTYERERAAFVRDLEEKGIRANTAAWREYIDAFDAAQMERRTLRSQLDFLEREKKMLEERTKERLKEEERFASEAEKINDQIGQSLTDALINGSLSAKDYMVNLFKTMVLRPVLQPIISGTLGAFGVGAAGAAIAGVPGGEMAGGGDLFGMLSAGKSAYDVLSGGFTAVGNAASTLTATLLGEAAAVEAVLASTSAEMMAANVAALESIGATSAAVGAAATVLAGVAAGLTAGSFISGKYSLFGNDPMVATALGTAAGAAIGLAFGPVGAAIGAFIGGAGGGLINRAFGRGPKETQAAGITGTLSAGDSDLMAFQEWSRKGGWFSSGSRGQDFSALDQQIVGFLNQETAAIGLSVAILAQQLGQSSDRITEYSEQIRIDLLNLSDEEAQEKITEALGRFSDNLVNFIVPSIQFMTKEGETSSEALSRLSTSIATVNSAFAMMGIQTQELSLNSAQAASNLIDLVGGIDAFTQKTDFLYQNFYTQQERVAQLTDQVSGVFEQLGFVMPTTREGFKQLYEVVAGSGSASLTAALLNLAPAMNEVLGYTEQLTEAQRQQSAAIANERLGLERQLMQALDNTVALREMELDALDASNRALQEQLFALEDSQTALDEASVATDLAFSKLEQALQNQLVNTLNDLETAFNALTDSLNDQISAARVASQVAGENLRDMQSVFSTLDREINSLLRGTTQSTAQGFAFIAQALQAARTTGYLPDEASLSQAISAARGGLGAEQFSTGFEQRRATAVLANQLIELRDITGDQVTVAERQISIAEAQLVVLTQRLDQAQRQYEADQEAAQSEFDRQLEEAQNQINVLRDIDDSVFGVENAISLLKSSIDAERGLQINLQKQMIALQEDANARAQAEKDRLKAEREAEAKRQAAEAKAIADAEKKAEERRKAEAAAAEEARVAREKAVAEAADRAAAEEAARKAAEEKRRQSLIDIVTGGNTLLGGSGSSPYTSTGREDDTPRQFVNITGNADGGYWNGGLSLVGEEGPELVNFARPSMIYTAGETAEILNGGAKTAETTSEIRQLRADNQAQSRALVSLQARMTRLLERWDGDGLPTERYEETTA
jgi:phage-related minor tail protein